MIVPTRTRAGTLRSLLVAAVAFALFLLLGQAVAHVPPGPLDRIAFGIVGSAFPLASALTTAGRFPSYVAVCIVVLVAGLVRRTLLRPALISVVALILAWKTSDVFKDYFMRPRPTHWVGIHETSFSYASGHAALSLTFYGFWAYVAWTSALPLRARVALVALLVLFIGGIGWSRLALGAHYPSDVAGGYLFGAGFLALESLVYERIRSRAPIAPM
ncbi:MAG: phosphatase PAP2 family protein [Vulcanimicrobiaceae bacterium]